MTSLSKADVPLPLQPQDEPEYAFLTLNKEQAQRVQACFEREKLYKEEIEGPSSVWGYLLGGVTAGFALSLIVRH